VGEAIESALAQTYPHKEVIVIDDGSTDNSLEVILSFDGQIRWETAANRGGCAARNRGLELAQGELIQFLDADDLLNPDKLDHQVPVSCSRSSEIVYCDFQTEVIGQVTQPLLCSRIKSHDSVIFALETIITTGAPLYARDMLLRIGGWRKDLPCAQDYELNLRLAIHGARFHHLPTMLYTVRRRPDSLSNDSVRVLDQWEEIYWQAYRFLQDNDALTDARAETFAAGFARQARAYMRYGLYEKAENRFRDAYTMHSSGGLRKAYGRWTRKVRTLLGPIATEKIVQLKRRITTRALPGNVSA
jgi:glycosyltransferase involved in cell wall biosynthesis